MAWAVLDTCDRRRAIGRRDDAVILSLLRLGLRASAVAALTFDGIDWRAAEIVLVGKDECLPEDADGGRRSSHLANIDLLRSADGGRGRRHQRSTTTPATAGPAMTPIHGGTPTKVIRDSPARPLISALGT